MVTVVVATSEVREKLSCFMVVKNLLVLIKDAHLSLAYLDKMGAILPSSFWKKDMRFMEFCVLRQPLIRHALNTSFPIQIYICTMAI